MVTNDKYLVTTLSVLALVCALNLIAVILSATDSLYTPLAEWIRSLV